MGDQSATQELQQAMPHGGITGWPDGWYIYENGRLDGPLSAAETFTLDAETSDGKPRLVSRKGFTQWYALKDLSEIFKITEQMEQKVHAAKEGTSAAKKPVVQAKRIELGKGKMPAAEAPRAAEASEAHLRHEQNVGVKASERPRGATTVTAPAKSVAPASRQQKATAKKAVLQEYYLARARLRLGRVRNPWMTSLVGVPVSLGIYWAVWFVKTQHEIVFHTQGAGFEPKWARLQGALAMVPLLHMYMVYRLAKRIREMEVQNKYRHISLPLAVSLSLLPPVGMVYLQSSLNRHWLLHAKHLVLKRRAEATK